MDRIDDLSEVRDILNNILYTLEDIDMKITQFINNPEEEEK